ncbi:hypothetical protein hairong_131 [Pseudomonas phage hairong]|nr:hypothetical protein hairong_131 [Pseudomonas phage hairong]
MFIATHQRTTHSQNVTTTSNGNTSESRFETFPVFRAITLALKKIVA